MLMRSHSTHHNKLTATATVLVTMNVVQVPINSLLTQPNGPISMAMDTATMLREQTLMPSSQIQHNGPIQMVMATVTTQLGDLQMHLPKIQRNGLMKTVMDLVIIKVEQTQTRPSMTLTTMATTIRLIRCPNWRVLVI